MSITRTFTVTTTDQCMMTKIERVLAWMHINSHAGHSGTIATDVDGDGHEQVTVEGFDLEAHRPFVNDISAERRLVEHVGC